MALGNVEDVGISHVAEGRLYAVNECLRDCIIYAVYAEVKDLKSQVSDEVQMQYTLASYVLPMDLRYS